MARSTILALLCAIGFAAGREAAAVAQAPINQTPAVRTPAPAVVSGVITDARTHRPISGVRVYLGPGPNPPGRSAYRFTDARGRFVFVDAPPGDYSLSAEKPGYADGVDKDGVTLVAGQWLSTANIEMVKLGVISGAVTDENGEPVIGAYVRVLMPFLLAGTQQLAAGPAAKTDDEGNYRLIGLAPGRYYVAVPSVQQSASVASSIIVEERDASGPSTTGLARETGGAIIDGLTALILGNYVTPPAPLNGRIRAYPVTFYPGALTLASAAAVDLGSGEDKTGVDVRLQPVATARVSGKLDGASAEYSGVTLRLMPAGLENLGAGSEAATTLVNPDGSFSFLNVPAGSYTLMPGSFFEFSLTSVAEDLEDGSVHRPSGFGYLPATPGIGTGSGHGGGGVPGAMLPSPVMHVGYNSFVPDSLNKDHTYDRLAVTVGADDVMGLVLPRLRTATLHVFVAYEDVTGAPPLGGLQLSAADGNNAALSPHVVFQSSAAWSAATHQAITISGVLPGQYVVSAAGMTGVSIKSVTAGGEDDTRRPIEVRGGEDIDVLVAFTGKLIALAGTVRDASGAAAPAASVLVFPVDRQLWTNHGLTPAWLRAPRASRTGAYQLSGLPAGEYYVVGIDPSQSQSWGDPQFLDAAVPFAKRVRLEWGDAKKLDVTLMVRK